MLNDDDPFWGSCWINRKTRCHQPKEKEPAKKVEWNLKFASLPLSMQGGDLKDTSEHDADPDEDLDEVKEDIAAITRTGKSPVAFGWYQEGYDREPIDPLHDPVDAEGLHASYITHHNGPQYFGYISNNPFMRRELHGSTTFTPRFASRPCPPAEECSTSRAATKMRWASSRPIPTRPCRKSSSATTITPPIPTRRSAKRTSPRPSTPSPTARIGIRSAIIVTWDDCEGDYDHVPPAIHSIGPDGLPLSDGPRVPLLLISPYARVHYVAHAPGDHASVVKFVDHLFSLIPLADLPDEREARDIGQKKFGQPNLGPADDLTPGVTDLLDGFDPARLTGQAPPLPKNYVMIPDNLINTLPPTSGYGLKDLGITPVDKLLGIKNEIPPDFSPRTVARPTTEP